MVYQRQDKTTPNRKQQRRERQLSRIVTRIAAEVIAEQVARPVLVRRRKTEVFAEYTYFLRRKR